MIFQVVSLRLEFGARGQIAFPPGKAGNVFRGALGMALCEDRGEYARLFQPSGSGGPSGLMDRPRPYVIRAAHLDGVRLEPGERFETFVHLFDLDPEARRAVAGAFARIGEQGIGPGRGRAELRSWNSSPAAIDLAAPVEARRLRVHFETPTELKAGGQVASEPAFEALFSRARDRISTLRSLYQGGALPIDFRELAARASRVRLRGQELSWTPVERFSTRTGQTHPIGGMTGWAEYEGELGGFVPYLEAARWTGVGRQTVWGKGAIRVQLLE